MVEEESAKAAEILSGYKEVDACLEMLASDSTNEKKEKPFNPRATLKQARGTIKRHRSEKK